jgi:hypothetical protein
MLDELVCGAPPGRNSGRLVVELRVRHHVAVDDRDPIGHTPLSSNKIRRKVGHRHSYTEFRGAQRGRTDGMPPNSPLEGPKVSAFVLNSPPIRNVRRDTDPTATLYPHTTPDARRWAILLAWASNDGMITSIDLWSRDERHPLRPMYFAGAVPRGPR